MMMSLPKTAVLGGIRPTPVGGGRGGRAGLIAVLAVLISCVSAQAALAFPKVTKVSPTEGPAAGGTEVTITGSGFESITGVHFGATAAIKYTVTSSSKITAEAPTHADGTVDIVVETREAESETTSADHYTFTGALPKAPEDVTPPMITPEKPTENGLETTTSGTWTGLPSTYKYQWLHCKEKTCEEISSATKSTFVPPYKYVGETLEVSVVAENAGGKSKPAPSPPTKVVASNGVVEYHTGFNGLEGVGSGPEEHVWFSASKGVGVMTTAGASLKEYSLAESSREAIAEGSDHNLWFTEEGKIGKVTPSGTITEYTLPEGVEPHDIVKGPDGNMWFTAATGFGGGAGEIIKMTTAGVVAGEYPLPEAASDPRPAGITAGPEESLWVTVPYEKTTDTSKIDKVTTAGKITQFTPLKCGEFGGELGGITEGSDGNLWYVQVTCNRIMKMTPAGVFTEYKAGPEYPREITSSSKDSDLWYTSWWGGNSHVTKMTTAGVISTEYALQGGSDPAGITVGPDKKLWIAAGSEVATIEP